MDALVSPLQYKPADVRGSLNLDVRLPFNVKALIPLTLTVLYKTLHCLPCALKLGLAQIVSLNGRRGPPQYAQPRTISVAELPKRTVPK